MSIENMMQEYIYNLCEIKNIPIDLRFACFGDVNKFYTGSGTEFSVSCASYYTKDVQDIKNLFESCLEYLWKDGKMPYNRMALYVENIADMNGWYDVILGCALFNDNTVT